MSNKKTIDFYNNNVKHFIQTTQSVEFKDTQDEFLSKIPSSSKILDFGCGSGRDTKYFLEKGYFVKAIDGSKEICKNASEYTGIDVKCMLFQDLNEVNEYEGVWACSSILHLSKDELKETIIKMSKALKIRGVIYSSFKYGDFEGERNGRYFTDMTEKSFKELIKDIKELNIEEQWITSDVRPGRGEEKWLNIILRKS